MARPKFIRIVGTPPQFSVWSVHKLQLLMICKCVSVADEACPDGGKLEKAADRVDLAVGHVRERGLAVMLAKARLQV
jgi:hypothetical protein